MRKLDHVCRASLVAVACLLVGSNASQGATITFTAADVISWMDAQGAPLHDSTYQWGLWAVRVMPVVNGTYTITGGSTTQTGWGVDAPNTNPAWAASPYTGGAFAWFYDYSGSEAAGNPANPLYMIMDQPANTFVSSTFNGSGVWVADVPPATAQPPGYDGGAGGTNVVTAVNGPSQFTLNFTLGAGSTWSGAWQFVVDGSRYNLGTSANPGVWVQNFFGGYGTGGDLPLNVGGGYTPAPEPFSLLLLGSGLLALAAAARHRGRAA